MKSQAKRKEEQRHTNFGEQFDIMNLNYCWPGGVRTYRNSSGDVADEQRQAKKPGQQSSGESGNDDENEILCNTQGSESLLPSIVPDKCRDTGFS